MSPCGIPLMGGKFQSALTQGWGDLVSDTCDSLVASFIYPVFRGRDGTGCKREERSHGLLTAPSLGSLGCENWNHSPWLQLHSMNF